MRDNTMLKEIREEILREIHGNDDLQDRELLRIIDRHLESGEGARVLRLSDKIRLRQELYNSLKRLDVLQELLDDPRITEIMINGPGEIFIERDGHMERWNGYFESEEKLEDIIQTIVGKINRRVNLSSPIVDARLGDGSRVHIVLPPVALKGPTLTIRKFPEPVGIPEMIRNHTISAEAAQYLRCLVEAGYNIFISGGTSSGKTTFLNALSSCIPPEERVITIEDSAELQIRQIPNLVRLETRDASTEGLGAVTMSMLIKASLRMRPDRIIVGEVRGGEAFDMLQAMNTGHDGSLSTGHANSTEDMLLRLESMVLMAVDLPVAAIKSQIAAGIDLMVHLARMPDRSRRVTEITEVTGAENGEIRQNPIYVYDAAKDRLEKRGSLICREKLLRKGGRDPDRLQDVQAEKERLA